MPEFLLSKLKRAKPSMRRRLLLYMGALAALLLFSLFAVLLLLGQLKSPREEMKKSLTFQMEAFRSDVTSLWRNVSVMGVHLSEDMTALIEERVKDFDALSGSADALEQLEASMLGPLVPACAAGRLLRRLRAVERLAQSPMLRRIPSADFMCSAATPSIPPAICCSTGA